MQNSKFLKLFRSLAENEVPSFRKHLEIAHRNEKVALAVFDYIRKFYPDFSDDKRLDLDYAYRKIFPYDDEPNRKKILNALSDLTLWLRNYLLLEKVSRQSFEGQLFLTMILKERRVEDELVKSVSILRNIAVRTAKSGVNDYLNSMQACHFIYYNIDRNQREVDTSLLRQCSDDMDIAYAVSKIKLACEMADLNNMYVPEYDLSALPLILDLSKKYSAASPLLQLYTAVYHLITTKEDQWYHKVEAILHEYAKAISNDEIHVVMSYMRNYVAVKIKGGDESVWQRAHNLNRIGLASGYYQKDNMTATQFTNIINTACVVGDIEWARLFIQELRPFLDEQICDDTITLSEAMICSAQKNAAETLAKLEQTNFKDIHLNIRARSLILKSYYELGVAPSRILHYCSSFTAFLNRKHKSYKPTVDPMLNFVKIVKMLAGKTKSKKAILLEIENSKPIYFKAWLQEMCQK